MMWFALLFPLFLWSSALAEGTVVHSRDDLLRGVHVDRFWDFQRTAPELAGGGEISGGLLRVEAPWGGGWIAAEPAWQGALPYVVEWEERRGSGPPEGEHGLLLLGEEEDDRVLVRFSWEGRVSVERGFPARPERIAGPVTTGRIHTGGWDRYAVRVERRRVIVLAGGEEVLVAGLAADGPVRIAFACGPGASSDVDHIALHRPGKRPRDRKGDLPLRPFYFDSFTVGRLGWMKNLFPVREGMLRVEADEEGGGFDFLDVPLPARSLVIAELGAAGPAELLFHGRPEGAGHAGFVVRFDEEGGVTLSRRRFGAEEAVYSGPPDPPRRPGGARRLEMESGDDRLALTANDRLLFEWEEVRFESGFFGARSAGAPGFGIDRVVIAGPRTEAPFDTAAASVLWEEIGELRRAGAHGTAADRIHDLFLMAPELPGVLDLYFREAVRGGDTDGATAAAEAIRFAAADGGEEEKVRILSLLLDRRWDEAHGALARFRAFRPDDPFALENTLLLLDRTGRHERVIREYEAARAGGEPLRAAGHGVAAWAYLRTATPERAGDALRAASRQGPGRGDLALAEGDLLRARGDMIGALARYETLLERGAVPVPEENIRLRIALLRFEMGDYERGAREIGVIPASGDPEVERARALVRAAALFRSGRVKDGAGREDLAEARAIAEALFGEPLGRGDAVIFDLLGRIEAALAEIDLRDGASYESYRARRAVALRNFDYASRFDPSFRSAVLTEGEVPDLDPGRFRFLVRAALPDDHPVGGFIENRSRWSAWSIVDRRADLAETESGRILGGGDPR